MSKIIIPPKYKVGQYVTVSLISNTEGPYKFELLWSSNRNHNIVSTRKLPIIGIRSFDSNDHQFLFCIDPEWEIKKWVVKESDRSDFNLNKQYLTKFVYYTEEIYINIKCECINSMYLKKIIYV